MTKLEFETFVTHEIQGRWPKWDPSPVVLDDWYAILRPHSVAVAREAILEHRIGEKANQFEPKIQEVRKLLRQWSTHIGQAVELVYYDAWIR